MSIAAPFVRRNQDPQRRTDIGRLIVEQIISADGYAAELDGGIGFFTDARGINDADQDPGVCLEAWPLVFEVDWTSVSLWS